VDLHLKIKTEPLPRKYFLAAMQADFTTRYIELLSAAVRFTRMAHNTENTLKFCIFVLMNKTQRYRVKTSGIHPVILDMGNHCTWSFPEFVPFCSRLYYFSSHKEFSACL
jgi:hypothetical protein